MTSPNRPAGPGSTWTPAELGTFVEQVRDDRFFALWLLVATTGMSLDVVTRLDREDVDVAHGRVCPSPAPSGSCTARRGFVLDPTVREAMKDHVASWEIEREVLRQRTEKLFVWSNGEQVDPGSVRTMFRQHCSLALLPVVPFREVRQAYVVAALASGIPVPELRGTRVRAVRPLALTRGQVAQPLAEETQSPTRCEGGAACRSRDC